MIVYSLKLKIKGDYDPKTIEIMYQFFDHSLTHKILVSESCTYKQGGLYYQDGCIETAQYILRELPHIKLYRPKGYRLTHHNTYLVSFAKGRSIPYPLLCGVVP